MEAALGARVRAGRGPCAVRDAQPRGHLVCAAEATARRDGSALVADPLPGYESGGRGRALDMWVVVPEKRQIPRKKQVESIAAGPSPVLGAGWILGTSSWVLNVCVGWFGFEPKKSVLKGSLFKREKGCVCK